jgi:hypothetical protein
MTMTPTTVAKMQAKSPLRTKPRRNQSPATELFRLCLLQRRNRGRGHVVESEV